MRKAHKLAANKSASAARYRIFFDTESRVIDLKHYPYLLIACFSDERTKKEKWLTYENEFSDFWQEVAEYGGKKTAVSIYAHNIGYDLLVTAGVPALADLGFVVTSFFEKGTTFILTMRKSEEYINRKGEKQNRVQKTLNFVSTTNFFPFRLAVLGEIFGLGKIAFDFETGSIEEARVYCRRDVEICKLATETFIKFVADNDLGVLAKTTPGQAFNAYRHRFMPEEIWLHDNPKAIALERAGYYGGRVECLKVGMFHGDFYGYDINSMYPFVMREHTFPVKLIGIRKRNSIADVRRLIEDYTLIGEFTINTTKPVFPAVLNNNLLFPVGMYKTVLSTPEIQYALDHDLLVAAGDIAVYQKANIFKEYVTFFISKRQEAKQAGNRVFDFLFKLFGNSLYGKFGQKSENWERQGDYDPMEIKLLEVINADTKKKETYKIFGGSIFQKMDEEEAFNSFCAIAAHVTAYARMLLWSYIELCGWENVYYMDTDSLFVNEIGHQKLQAAGVTDNTEIGKMKLEKTGNKLTVNAPKDYIFAGEVKMKGVTRGSQAVTDLEKLKILAEKMKVSRESLPERVYENVHWPKFNSQIRAGNLSEYMHIVRLKVLNGKYNKGWLSETGEMIPFAFECLEGKNKISQEGR